MSVANWEECKAVVEAAWERRAELGATEADAPLRAQVDGVLDALESGQVRIAEPVDGAWRVNDWLKKAVLLSFRLNDSTVMDGAPAPYWDKVPLRFSGSDEAAFRRVGARVVPGAVVRRGAHIGKDVVLMPSFVNIGAYVGAGTMVDTWATVGSCAQIGARSEVVEGVIVERGSVIGMGVFLGQSTKIYDRATGEISYGRVPAGSVVVAGSLPAADGSHSLYCAVIVKRVDEKTRSKTSINELLRD